MKFAPVRMQAVPEEFTRVHTVMMLPLAYHPRMRAVNPDSVLAFSQARAKATRAAREALSRFQMAGLTLRLARWGATLSPWGRRESLNGTHWGEWVGVESVLPCSLAAERGTLLPRHLGGWKPGVPTRSRSDVPRGEQLCGECSAPFRRKQRRRSIFSVAS